MFFFAAGFFVNFSNLKRNFRKVLFGHFFVYRTSYFDSIICHYRLLLQTQFFPDNFLSDFNRKACQ